MLHILLLILKIIGILLLCLLGVLVLSVICILFVPVRYRFEADRREGEGEPPVALHLKATWLLHFVNLVLRFDGSLFVRLRIIVFTLFRRPGEEKNGRKWRRKSRPVQEEAETEGDTSNRLDESTNWPEDRLAESANVSEDRLEESTDVPKEESDAEPSFWDRLRAIPGILRGILIKIKSLFENIQYTIQKFCDRIRSVSDTAAYYRDVIEGETFQRSYALCKGELARIGKSLKPQKFQARLLVGMDDPAATGQVLAVCGMLYPLLGGCVDVAGDFEKKRLEGHVSANGKIRIFTLLWVLGRLYYNKDIRKLYQLLKKEAV